MTAIAIETPVRCRCGKMMRIAAVRDAWECRCGMWVDGSAVYDKALHPMGVLPDSAFQQGEPWKDPPPGLRVSDKFSNIGDLCWETLDVDRAMFPPPAEWQRMCANAFECSGVRYVGNAETKGKRDLTVDGETILRHGVYAIVPVGQEAEAIGAIVRFIRDKHGTGKIWAHGDVPIGPLKKRAQNGYRGAELSGVLHVVVGCYYFHRTVN